MLRAGGLLLVAAVIALAVVGALIAAQELTGMRALGWAAAAVAFPLGPLLWCGVGEARRSPGTLTRVDRCTLRTMAFDTVVIIVCFGFGGAADRMTVADARQLWALPTPVSSPVEVAVDTGTTTTRVHVEFSSTPSPPPRPVPDPPATARPVAESPPPSSDPSPAQPSDPAPAPAPVPAPTHEPGPSARRGAPVDLQCADGQFEAATMDSAAPLDDLLAAYDPQSIDRFVDETLRRRYPMGAKLVEGGRSLTDCVGAFTTGQTDTAEDLIMALPTVVHECGHLFDIANTKAPGRAHLYALAPEHTFTCRGGGLRSTFARARLMEDEEAAKRPTCAQGDGGACDRYADTYLTGTSGDQGFDLLMEELVQYTHGLVTAHAVSDVSGGRFANASASHRDGVLTFLWYLERYLRLARLEHPRVHARLLKDACWRGLVLSAWGRAWHYLDATSGNARMGIDDAEIEALVRDPDLLEEIDRVRTAHGCTPTGSAR